MTKSFGLILLVTMMSAGAMAQPVMSPAVTSAIAAEQRAAIADQHAAIKAEVSTAHDQERATAATREQIQVIRSALRARLATLHH